MVSAMLALSSLALSLAAAERLALVEHDSDLVGGSTSDLVGSARPATDVLRRRLEGEEDSYEDEEGEADRRRLADNTQPPWPDIKYTKCTPMHAKRNLWLDRQHVSFDDKDCTFNDNLLKTPLRGFRMNRPDVEYKCDDSKNLRFQVTGLLNRALTYDKCYRTAWNLGANASIIFFDRHTMNCNKNWPSTPRVMLSWRLETRTGNDDKIRFKYTCGRSSQGIVKIPYWYGESQYAESPWRVSPVDSPYDDVVQHPGGWHRTAWAKTGGMSGTLEYLDRLPVLCPEGEALAQIQPHTWMDPNQEYTRFTYYFRLAYRCIVVGN